MSIFLKRALAPLLLSLFALPSIGATPPPRLAATEIKFKDLSEVKNASSIKNGGNYVIIATATQNNNTTGTKVTSGSNYAMPPVSAGNYLTLYKGTSGSEPVAIVADTVIDDSIIWTFTEVEPGNFVIFNGSNYVYYSGNNTSSNNYLYLGDFNAAASADKNKYKWTINSESLQLYNVEYDARRINYNAANPRFAAYLTDQVGLKLYEVVVAADPETAAKAAVAATKSKIDNILKVYDEAEGVRSLPNLPLVDTANGSTINYVFSDIDDEALPSSIIGITPDSDNPNEGIVTVGSADVNNEIVTLKATISNDLGGTYTPAATDTYEIMFELDNHNTYATEFVAATKIIVQNRLNPLKNQNITAISENLPVFDANNGSTISYATNAEDVLSVDSNGAVTINRDDLNDIAITLTATIVNNKDDLIVDNIPFDTVVTNFTVLSYKSEANSFIAATKSKITDELANLTKDNLVQTDLVDAFALTLEDDNGSVVSYAVLDGSNQPHSAINIDPATGLVTVSSAMSNNVAVKIVATITNDNEGTLENDDIPSDTVTINFTVRSHLSYAQDNANLLKNELQTTLDNIDTSEAIFSLANLPVSISKDPLSSPVVWVSSNASVATVAADTGAVTLVPQATETSITLTGTVSNTYSSEEATADATLTFTVGAVADYNISFVDYSDLNTVKTGGTTLFLNEFNEPFKPGKVFNGWVEVGNEGAGVVTSVLVNKDYTFKAKFSDNYVSSNTDSSLKLDFAKTQSTKLEWSTTAKDATVSPANISPVTAGTNYASNLGLSADIFNLSFDNIGTDRVVLNATSIRLRANGGDGAKLIVVVQENYKIQKIEITIGDSGTNHQMEVKNSSESLFSGGAGTSGTKTVDNINDNTFTIQNINTGSNTNYIGITSIKIHYFDKVAVEDITYTPTNKTGIRFGTTFDITGKTETEKFGDMGTLIIPKWILDDENISIIDYFLTKGVRGVEPDSLLIEIKADNVDDSVTNQLTFSGVLTNLPSSLYDVDLVGICYYEYDEQIYFSHEKTDSLHDIAQSLIQAGGYNEYVLAALSQI